MAATAQSSKEDLSATGPITLENVQLLRLVKLIASVTHDIRCRLSKKFPDKSINGLFAEFECKESTVWRNLHVMNKEIKCLSNKQPKLTKADVIDKIEKVRVMLVNTEELVSLILGLSKDITQQHLDQVNILVSQVRDNPPAEEEIQDCKLLWWRTYVENTIRDTGVKEAEGELAKDDFVNLLSFLGKHDHHIRLPLVYSELTLTQASPFNKISYKDILKEANPASDERPSLILVKGRVGSGKTVLAKWLALKWSQSRHTIPRLKEHDLVVRLNCTDHHTESLKGLYKGFLPKSCADLGVDDISSYLCSLKILYIIDGFDEASKNSLRVLREILHFGKTKHNTVLVTCRPENHREFLSLVPPNYEKCILNIDSIPVEDLGDFVRKYHDELVKAGKSEQSTGGAAAIHQQIKPPTGVLQDPLNLTLLVYLWAYWPDTMNNKTTITEVYDMMYAVMEERLLSHLRNRYCQEKPFGAFNITKEFKRNIYTEALISSNRGFKSLDSQSVMRLMSLFFLKEDIQFREVASTYLAFTEEDQIYLTPGEPQLSFQSEDIQNYFAAKGLVLAATDMNFYTSLMTLVSSCKEISDIQLEYEHHYSNNSIIRQILKLGNISVRVKEQRNILRHLSGLMNKNKVKEELIQEVVLLLEESGVTAQEDWLDLLGAVRCSQETARFIVQSYFDNVERINIESSGVAGFSVLMPHLNPSHVKLNFVAYPDDLPHLDLLLQSISEKNCTVDVGVWQHYHDPGVSSTTDSLLLPLLHKQARCGVKKIVGSVQMMLPSTLTDLYLGLATDQQASTILPNLRTLPHLQWLQVSVTRDINPSVLSLLPKVKTVGLTLLDVRCGEEDKACQVAAALQLPPQAVDLAKKMGMSPAWITARVVAIAASLSGFEDRRYSSITFTGGSLDVAGMTRVVDGLARMAVKLDVLNPPASQKSWHVLTTQTHIKLGAKLIW